MATTADIKNGMVINYNNDLYSIIEFLHVKPGKGPAFVRTKLRSLTSGKVIDNTFNSGVAIYPVRVERRKFQYLFEDDYGYNFMDNETFEQILLDRAMVEAADLMKEGQEVEILINTENEKAISCELPPFVELKITYTEPGVRGDTTNTPKKPATVETGATLQYPFLLNKMRLLKLIPERTVMLNV